jgi:hypothetical protein
MTSHLEIYVASHLGMVGSEIPFMKDGSYACCKS